LRRCNATAYGPRHGTRPFTFADGEVIQARFMTWTEVDALVRDERVCPDSIELALPLVRRSVLGG
jgi:hypothetical protein